MRMKKMPKVYSLEDFEKAQNFAFANYSFAELVENGIVGEDNIELLPLPFNSLKNGAVCPEKLPEVMQKINLTCEKALDLQKQYGKSFKSKYFMTLYEIRTAYLECLYAIKKHKVSSDEVLSIDYSMNILSNKLQKLGMSTSHLLSDLEENIEDLNKKFFKKFLDNGEEIVVSKGVILKSILDNAYIDATYLDAFFKSKAFLKGDVFLKDHNYTCYLLDSKNFERVALDFCTIDGHENLFEDVALGQGFEEFSDKGNRQVLKNTVFLENRDCFVAENIKGLNLI